jgi:hypothetical protein
MAWLLYYWYHSRLPISDFYRRDMRPDNSRNQKTETRRNGKIRKMAERRAAGNQKKQSKTNADTYDNKARRNPFSTLDLRSTNTKHVG